MRLRSFREMVIPLTLDTLLLLEMTRSMISESLCVGILRLESTALTLGLLITNSPKIEAFSSPVRISSVEALAPKRSERESMTKLLPAPVAPVRTLKPSLKETSMFSIIARFLIDKWVSIVMIID